MSQYYFPSMKKIAFTFAGRRDRMQSQLAFMARALERGIIDEWHVWNFARNLDDDTWLRETFDESVSLITDEQSISYTALAQNAESLSLSVLARNDAHLLIHLDSGESIEIVLGAFSNTKCLVRIFVGAAYRLHAPAQGVSDNVLDPCAENNVSLVLEKSVLKITLRGEPLFHLRTRSTLMRHVGVHTGYGAWGEWRLQTEPKKTCLKNAALKHYKGFRLAYNYYSSARFGDAAFVKLDDDIVYCDLRGLEAFVNEVVAGPLEILSANVINNGVCAHLQEKSGLFGGQAFCFEYPPAGVCGRLWESSDMCRRLHEYFLANRQRVLEIAGMLEEKVELPIADRFSINFVGFRYPIMLMMAMGLQYGIEDDEHVMTRVITVLFGVRKYVFSRFIVSHLSFFKQDETLDARDLLAGYSRLHA